MRAGSDSRSINTGFIRPTFVWEVNDHDTLTAALKVYGYYDRASENRDINEYRGYADLLLKYRHDDWVFSTLLRRGHLGYYAELNLGMPMGDFLTLVESGLAKGTAEEVDAQGVSRAFYPHGLGHSLGLVTHDVGCASLRPRADNPFLRNTSTIAEGQVFTIEPGLYFIDGLLAELRAKPAGKLVDWNEQLP